MCKRSCVRLSLEDIMASHHTGGHMGLVLVLVVALFTCTAHGQSETTDAVPVTTYVYIGIISGGVTLVSAAIAIYKSILNPTSDYYKCKCITGGNAVDAENAIPGYERMGAQDEAQTIMATIDNIDRTDWHTPPERVNQVVEDLRIEMMDEAVAGERPRQHLLITYEPSSREDVLHFRKRLRSERYRVWIDTEKMSKHVGAEAEAMAKAIEGAAVVVPVLTSMYQQDAKCKKEIEFADKIKKTLVPVRMQKKYRPEGWLAFLLGNTLFHDLSNEHTYQAQIDNFLEALESVGVNAKIADDDFDDD